MTRASIAALAALLLAACFQAEPTYERWSDPGTKEAFLGFDVMPEIEFLVEPDAVASLEASPYEYVPATMIYDGRSYGPIGLRLKGQNSFLPFSEKPALRINIDEYVEGVTFYELQDLTFNNMSSDWSMMHERLSYLVAREAGLPASRANHALVTVNGDFYGLYANLETIKPRMLKEWFDDQDGPLYEATDVDFEAQYVDQFEHKNGPDDRTLIEGLAQALALPDANAAIEAAEEFVDIDHFQRFWAMESVVGQFDAFPYSIPGDDYRLYADPTSDKLWFLPWGMDETFFAADVDPLQVHSVFARRCMESPACYQGYVAHVWAIVDLIEELDLDGVRADVEAQIAPYVDQDTRKPYTADQVREGQTQLGYFIRYRRETLGNFMPPP